MHHMADTCLVACVPAVGKKLSSEWKTITQVTEIIVNFHGTIIAIKSDYFYN